MGGEHRLFQAETLGSDPQRAFSWRAVVLSRCGARHSALCNITNAGGHVSIDTDPPLHHAQPAQSLHALYVRYPFTWYTHQHRIYLYCLYISTLLQLYRHYIDTILYVYCDDILADWKNQILALYTARANNLLVCGRANGQFLDLPLGFAFTARITEMCWKRTFGSHRGPYDVAVMVWNKIAQGAWFDLYCMLIFCSSILYLYYIYITCILFVY